MQLKGRGGFPRWRPCVADAPGRLETMILAAPRLWAPSSGPESAVGTVGGEELDSRVLSLQEPSVSRAVQFHPRSG